VNVPGVGVYFKFVSGQTQRQANSQGTRLRVPDSCHRQKHRSGVGLRGKAERRRHFTPNGVNFLMSSV